MRHVFLHRNQPFTIDLQPSGKAMIASLEGRNVPVEVIRMEGNRLDLLIDGRAASAYVTRDGQKFWVTVNGQTMMLVSAPGAVNKASRAANPDSLSAQMPGLVRMVAVREGDLVKKGQTLAIIEAMKMENKVTAPFDGLVKKLMVKVGQIVEREQLLLELSKPVQE